METHEATRHEIASSKRNWPEFREWISLFTALAALVLGVVSFWTTTQISGLENYLRSEISRRNAEIEDSESRAERLELRVEASEERLEDLRAASERFSAASSEAQSSLISSQQALTKTNAELSESRDSLSKLSNEVARKEEQIDTFRRRSVIVNSRLFLSGFPRPNDENWHLGRAGLEDLQNVGLSVSDRDLIPLYAVIRNIGPKLCRHLETYGPELPDRRKFPTSPTPPGEQISPTQYRMTPAQRENWDIERERYDHNYAEVLRFNKKIADARFTADQYVRESINYCACAALRADSFEPEAVCKTTQPSRPYIAEILASD